jgi:hypothetical protein
MKLVENGSSTFVTLRYGDAIAARTLAQNRLKCIEDRAMSGAPFVDD